MMTPLSLHSRIVLLTLALLLLFSAAQDFSGVSLPCCYTHQSRKVGRIRQCFEQKPRDDCDHHAFLVINRRGQEWCIDPAAPWLQRLIKAGKLDCPQDVTLNTTLAAPQA